MSDLLNKASLVMVPSGYKEDTVYSVVPSDGSGDLSFTRASNGTRVNSAGLVEVCPWNLVEYSEDFSNGNFWGASNESLTTNATTAPNGTSTADLLIPSAGTGDHYLLSGTVSNISGQVVTLSLFVKKKDNDYFYFGTGGASAFGAVVYQFSTNTFVVAGLSATATNIGNGWIRLSITGTTGATDLRLLFTPTDSTGSRTYNANGTDGTYIWGAQANIGATLKPYFPTTDRLNVPRLTYQNGGGGCPSLLLEKQSTNVNENSNNFVLGTTQTYDWYDFNGKTPVANQGTSPDGTNNAWSIPQNSYLTTLYGKSIGLTTGDKTTASIWAKGNETAFRLTISASTDGAIYGDVYVNLTTGAITSGSGTIESYGNGWYRITTTGTSNQNNGYPRIVVRNPNASCLIYGSQFEASSYATSYIPTTSSSATRVADACYKTGISSLIGQTEGVIFLDSYFDEADKFNLSINDGTSSNFIQIETTSGAAVVANINSGGVAQASMSTSSSFFIRGQRLKIAIAYKSNDFALYINGAQIATDSSGSVPSTDQFICARYNGSLAASQRVNELILFKTRLTNAELASLTTI